MYTVCIDSVVWCLVNYNIAYEVSSFLFKPIAYVAYQIYTPHAITLTRNLVLYKLMV
jgi:hypothetical protein